MTQYKSIKIPQQDYDTLKRYMHLGFHDNMTEAFHHALNTAMFEQYGEPSPAQQRKEWVEPEIPKEQPQPEKRKRGRPKKINH